MFNVQFREEVHEKIISRAKGDSRIVSAAVIGSYAKGTVDRWSDIDLTFGVNELFAIEELLDSWTDYVVDEFRGIVLFDVESGSTIYRVFILPGCLQLDLSFSPASEFGAKGPHFDLLYSKQYEKPQLRPQPNEKPQPRSQPTKELFGYLVHHLLRARFCMERNRLWQAEFWISEARNCALKLACQSLGLDSDYGRGFDDLPHDIHNLFKDSFVRQLSDIEILRAIKIIIGGIPGISEEVNRYSLELRDTLNELSS